MKTIYIINGKLTLASELKLILNVEQITIKRPMAQAIDILIEEGTLNDLLQ